MALVSAAVAVGVFYLWTARLTGGRFTWTHNLPGYYNYLARAFVRGQLHLEIQPSPKLLALPDPWDPAADESLRMHDMVLFHGRYYLYHGAGPAVLLFAPWRLISGHDLPESFAAALFCWGGFLFSCGTFLRLLDLAGVRLGGAWMLLLLPALGLCQSVPYLLNRVWVYEVAIAGGYFCLSGGLYALARAVGSARTSWWLGLAGLFFGLGISCRPHLALAAGVAVAGVAWHFRRTARDVLAFAVPLLMCGVVVAIYNYARFGSPFEFGIRYLLSGMNQSRIRLAWANLPTGLYYFLLCPPDVSAVFPWVRLVAGAPFHLPGHPFPPEYFYEPTAGALWLAPFLPAGAWLARVSQPGVRLLTRVLLVSSFVLLVFVAATGFTTQRYEVDFAPGLCLAAITGLGIRAARGGGIAIKALAPMAIACGIVAHFALAISGPYDEFLRSRPSNYLRLAGWFSPFAGHRPLLNPEVGVAARAVFRRQPDGFREPLVTLGWQAHRHLILCEHRNGKLRLLAQSEESTVAYELDHPGDRAVLMTAVYSDQSGGFRLAIDGREVIYQELKTWVAAPSQLSAGESRLLYGSAADRFTGKLDGLEGAVTPRVVAGGAK